VDAQVASTGTVIEHDLVNKKLADFHAAIEFSKGRKDPRFAVWISRTSKTSPSRKKRKSS
jgi:hypothetical protein